MVVPAVSGTPPCAPTASWATRAHAWRGEHPAEQLHPPAPPSGRIRRETDRTQWTWDGHSNRRGVFGLVDRGQVRVGAHADLVLFDAATVQDTATYDDPQRLPTGIHNVIVNGRIAFAGGQNTAAGAGRMLRYRRSAWGERE